MTLFQIIGLAVIQGAAELLPISSSAHVIVAEKWMGLDPSSPEMTFFLVMLHTGTMFSVLIYFWSRWKKWKSDFIKMIFLSTAVTGVVGLGLKKFIEKVILGFFMGESQAEIESLFKSLPLISFSLFSVGVLIFLSGVRRGGARSEKKTSSGKQTISPLVSFGLGLVQGLCLPFRGFSRSGATISVAMLSGVSRSLAEDFSFALAVLLTPPVIAWELHRLLKASGAGEMSRVEFGQLLFPGLLGMVFSFIAGLLALRWLSTWLEQGRWKFFGIYCIGASLSVFMLHFLYFR